jgi:hypothetical protein
MTPRKLIVLGIVAIALLAVALWYAGNRRPAPDGGLQSALAPGLADRLNEVERVRISTAGNAVVATLEQDESGWVLVERDRYPADTAKLRELLLRIAQARRVEAKTANPELHDRLGVEDIGQADAYGVQVTLEGGGEPLALVIGHNRTRGSGTYVRKVAQPQSWLVDRNIAVERSTANWLQRDLLDIDTARIVRVEVTRPPGPPVVIVRDEDSDGDFRLLDLPAGRELASEFVADATAGLLSSLRIDDVHSDQAVEPDPATLRQAHFLTHDGLRIDLGSWQSGRHTLAHFNATVDDTQAKAWIDRQQSIAASSWQQRQAEAEADADATDGAATDTEIAPAQPLAVSDRAADHDQWMRVVQEEAAALNARFAGRVFSLPEFKAANLNRDLEAYLRPQQ